MPLPLGRAVRFEQSLFTPERASDSSTTWRKPSAEQVRCQSPIAFVRRSKPQLYVLVERTTGKAQLDNLLIHGCAPGCGGAADDGSMMGARRRKSATRTCILMMVSRMCEQHECSTCNCESTASIASSTLVKCVPRSEADSPGSTRCVALRSFSMCLIV